MQNNKLRNVAIIAHVDHGKTTLVDEMLKQGGVYRENQEVVDRVMDSNDLERERGITILAKNTAIHYGDTKINIVDTPGHADFGGEVERILKMVNGVILLVDAAEGPMPQTRFVLSRALELGHRVIVVVNKIDRPDQRIHEVVDEVLELLLDLDATPEQLDSPMLFCSGRNGTASYSPDEPGTDLKPLFDTILNYIPAPEADVDQPFQMLVSAIDYNEFVGRMAIGRIERGTLKQNQEIMVCNYHDPDAAPKKAKAVSMYEFEGLGKNPVTESTAGNIICLSGIGDMERLVGRIVYGTAGGRDVVALKNAMARLPHVKELLSAFDRGRLGELAQLDTLEDLTDLIGRTLCDDPPFSVREGEFIREGFDPEVDRLRGILHGGKGIIASMEAAEKEKTGIRTLKIGYNKVFGYYIEVSNSFKDQVPETYIRKQTLVNGERYITQELKDLEHDILSASDRVSALEYELFTRLRQELSGHVARIQAAAAAVAEADCLCSLAAVAVKNNYCCPAVDESGVIEIHQGRHPVVEAMRPDALFVPNDTYMGRTQDRVSIITGPNMAGKSTYMRQVALMVLMAQIGSFVPAKAARLGIVDRVFTRIGASDDLSAGQSTFMVEMTEVSDILHAATDKSLLILDEIGRGTSTFDGMSIARAVLEYCADPKRLGAKTLFATHYHELTAMEGTLPGVKNYNIAVRARGEEIVFLRKIVPGGADRSYGIEVAKLAGLPDAVVSRARKILRQLEEESGRPAAAPAPREDQVSFAAVAEGEVIDRLRRTQVDSLTPLEALQLLYELKKKLT